MESYGLDTVGTYDARLPNGSGYDGYSGTWDTAPAELFTQILTGWKALGGKDTTTAGYWLCHNTNDTAVAGNGCVGLSGLEDRIIIFKDDPGKNSALDTKFVCFMDGTIPRDKVEGQPFCTDVGYGISVLFSSTGGRCNNDEAFKQHSFTKSLGDPSFYALSKQRGKNDIYCTTPGYLDLGTQKARWPVYKVSDAEAAAYVDVFKCTIEADGLKSRCGPDMEEWLDQIIPVTEPNGHVLLGGQ